MAAAARYVVRATLDEVDQLTQALKALMPVCLSEEEGCAIELGIAEVLTNIVKHGYPAHENGVLTLYWEELRGGLQVDIVDTGLPIAPHLLARESNQAFDFDPHDVAHLPESGFGLALVRAIFYSVDYESVEGVNRMRLQRALPV